MCACAYLCAGVYAFYQNRATHTHIQNRWVGSCALSQYNMLFVSFVSLYRWEWLTVHFNIDGTCYTILFASASASFSCSQTLFDFHHFLVFDRIQIGRLIYIHQKQYHHFEMGKRQKALQQHTFLALSLSFHKTYIYIIVLTLNGIYPLYSNIVSSIRRQNFAFAFII